MRLGIIVVGAIVLATVGAGCGALKSSQTYETCVTSSDCAKPGDRCVGVASQVSASTGSFCTQGCTVGADCSTSLDGRAGVCMCDNQCYSDCISSSDCPPGWSCQTMACRSGLTVCLPN